ncbi:MAG: ATP-binding protein [Treponema sp.]|nr:ATP-binding protein [Treponema sp.]
MSNTQEKTILKTIISLSNTLEGCKLEETVLAAEKENLTRLATYLGVDEISALLFAVIFIYQTQHSSAASITDIADYLCFPHLMMLVYTTNFSILKKKCLIDQKKTDHFGRQVGSDSGYEIPETIMECVIEDSPIISVEDQDEHSEAVFHEFFMLFKTCYKNTTLDENFYRTIAKLERTYKQNEIIKNIKKQFPNDLDTRNILYLLCSLCLTGKTLSNDDVDDEDFISDIMSCFFRYARIKKLNDETDILFEKGFVRKEVECSESFRHRPFVRTVLKLTAKGITTFFGSEAERYISEDDEKNDIEKASDALYTFGSVYEKHMGLYAKRNRLKKIEDRYAHLPFFKAIMSTHLDSASRFILYDCTKDFLSGADSGLGSTLRDYYGKSSSYFSVLRSILDEKHELIKKGFVEIEKDEVVEKTTITLADKTIEALYGENADLYIKKGVSGKNIIEPEKLKAKTLFYSESVQKQIDMLEESLNQQKLEAMQKRLEAKGLSKGVAVLLYGAPGTGKTETVYQLAKKTNRKILHVDIADSKSMWFGESEKIIKRIFTNYRQLCKTAERRHENTPILLFNEADALISKRRDVTSGNCAQTENAIQNILLEEMEKLDGIIFATTNLCNNMDKAFERRFLFKVEYEKPSLEARTKIWSSKLPALVDEELEKLARRFDFSGGEIDNIVRKCEMTEVINGKLPTYDEIVELCENERLDKEEERHVGFYIA